MGDQTQAYDIFQTPLSSGYPLPLNDSLCVQYKGDIDYLSFITFRYKLLNIQ